MKTVIVVPCYNEERRFDAAAFSQFAGAHSSIQFIFVDDGSKDKTATLLDEFCQRQPAQFRLLRLEKNVGKAEAVRQGMLRASQAAGDLPPADLIGFWDADLATPLEEISYFLEIFDEYPAIEMVFGSRVNLLGRSVKRNLFRHYLGRGFATVAASMLGMGIYDTQCGAKIFRNTREFQQILKDPFRTNWIFDVEILARYLQSRRKSGGIPLSKSIYEFPLHRWDDVPGSKLKSYHFLVALRDLWRIGWHYRK